jgi:GNAT superfamily N-acetyltransferase
MVRPPFRRRGIGAALLERAEDYLAAHGTVEGHAGPHRPRNPFYFSLYGGSDQTGFLDSDPNAAPFFEKRGYRCTRTSLVFQRRLTGALVPPDPRFAGLRRQFELRFLPTASVGSWWQDCVLGLVEPVEFRLEDRRSGQAAARIVVWEMDGFNRRWNYLSAGIYEFFVRSDLRRQGVGRFVVGQMMSLIREQEFGIVEVHVDEDNLGVAAFFRGLGFEPVDQARTFQKTLITAGARTV